MSMSNWRCSLSPALFVGRLALLECSSEGVAFLHLSFQEFLTAQVVAALVTSWAAAGPPRSEEVFGGCRVAPRRTGGQKRWSWPQT